MQECILHISNLKIVMSFISSGKAIFGGLGVVCGVVSVFACKKDDIVCCRLCICLQCKKMTSFSDVFTVVSLLTQKVDLDHLCVFVEEGSSKAKDHSLQETHRLRSLRTSVTMRSLDRQLIKH